MSEENKVVIRDDSYALVPTNPRVIQISSHLGWKPTTAIRRIQNALPSVLEQQVYLAILPEPGESGILPESMAKLLKMFVGYQRLQMQDLAPGSSGRNRFKTFVEFLGECIYLLKVLTKEHPMYSFKIYHAGLMVLHYGKENSERLITMVECNLDEICESFDIPESVPPAKRFRMCLRQVLIKVIPLNQKMGSPDLLDLRSIIDGCINQRKSMRRILGEESVDLLSLDRGSLWQNPDIKDLLKGGYRFNV